MAVILQINESVASNRCVPIWCVQSNGTSAATNESGRTFMFEIGGVFYGSGGSISAVSAIDGLYTCIFSASKISVPGVGQVMYSSGTALPASTPFIVMPQMRMGYMSTATISAGAATTVTLNSVDTSTADLFSGAGLTVQYPDGTYQDNVIRSMTAARVATVYNSWLSVPVSGMTYWLRPGGAQAWSTSTVSDIRLANYSGVSVEVKSGGIQTTSVGAGNYSGVSVEVKSGGIQTTSVGAGNYSGVSVEVKSGGIQTTSVGAGNYSGVSVEVKTGGIQVASMAAAAYSGRSFEVTTGGIQPVSVGAGNYSGMSVEVKSGGIQTTSVGLGNYSGVSVEVKTGGIQVASMAAGAYSGRSFEVTTGGIQTVSVGAGNYSGMSVEVKSTGIVPGSVGAGNYSGMSVEVKTGGIQTASLGAAALDSTVFATNAEQAFADRFLLRNIAGNNDSSRSVGTALFVLRNKVDASSSVGTVYQNNDTTSAYTFSITTAANAITVVTPAV